MNSVIETILSHRSIRKFTSQKIPAPMLESIIQSGIAASSSSLFQAVSIVRITDMEKRAALATLAGNQPYVASAAEFLVFIIDYARHHALKEDLQTDFTELMLIGAVDAGIMAQNCLLAAESLGLGGVYIGGLRNSTKEVHELLSLPKNTAVLFGMCLGFPDQTPELKPRLPADVILHENSYQPLDQTKIAEYDETMHEYYRSRSSNTKSEGWSEPVTNKLSSESRPHILPYLNSQGLAKR